MTRFTRTAVAVAVIEAEEVFAPLAVEGTVLEFVSVERVNDPCNDAHGVRFDQGYLDWLEETAQMERAYAAAGLTFDSVEYSYRVSYGLELEA
jgi:hypothetical protein